jgi:hypothetical protein
MLGRFRRRIKTRNCRVGRTDGRSEFIYKIFQLDISKIVELMSPVSTLFVHTGQGLSDWGTLKCHFSHCFDFCVKIFVEGQFHTGLVLGMIELLSPWGAM